MNDKHCGIIKDLLPLYVDQLTSEESNGAIKAHLVTCESCTTIYETLKTNGELTSDDTGKELDYLKKVRSKRKKQIIAAVAVCTLVFSTLLAVAIKTFVIGSPVAFYEIDYDRNDAYTGIGTKWNPDTNELTIYGELLDERLEFRGLKVGLDQTLVNTYDVTVYAAPRPFSGKQHNGRFKEVITIPDDNQIWSVYSMGPSPHDVILVWSNADILEEKFSEPQAKLTAFLTKHREINPETDYLEGAFYGDYGGESCWSFDMISERDDVWGALLDHYAISEDCQHIYWYNEATDNWEKVS